MYVASPEQMGGIDRSCIKNIGIPGVVLMENAALKVVEELEKSIGQICGRRILIFAGKGNNGGDAFAAARHLFNRGALISVCLTSGKDLIAGDAKINLDVLANMGIEVKELEKDQNMKETEAEAAAADAIMDGILGTGAKGEVAGAVKDAVYIINRSGKFILSIDIPSGVDGSSGRILGSAVKAHKTVTFGLPKTGVVIHPGCGYAGKLVVADIGIPGAVIEKAGIKVRLIDGKTVRDMLPERKQDSNKGDYGRVLIVSGSVGMTGAGCLAASAALRAGAGLVYLGVPASLVNVYDSLLMEAVTLPLEDKSRGFLAKECLPGIIERLKSSRVALIGPGLSVSEEITEIIAGIIEEAEIPLILDADALNAVSGDISVLKKLRTGAVITPHPGEMARLLGASTEEVQRDRIGAAAEFASRWNVNVVLKGSRTVVAFPDGRIYINVTGNSGMATAGTGDVLAGIIAGLAGQGVNFGNAAVAGVYLHGLAGDMLAEKKGEYGMIAGDLANELPYAIRRTVDC